MKPLCALILALAALAAVPSAASAAVHVAGSGEPAYTSSHNNTQFVSWDPTGGSYRLRIRWLVDTQEVHEGTFRVYPGNSGPLPLDWTGVRTLEEGRIYEICVQGESEVIGRWTADGPDTCTEGRQQGKRTYTTIDRTKPTTSIEIAGGAAFTKGGSVPLEIGFHDNLAGPYPATFLCVEAGAPPCDGTFVPSNACSVPQDGAHNTTFKCNLDLPALPDGPVTVCAIGADASMPDNSTSPDQHRPATMTNRSDASCDTILLDRTAPSLTADASKTAVLVGESVSFSASASDGGTGVDGGSVRWQWGDGSAEVPGFSAGHAFQQPGTYTVRVRAKDAAGNEAVAERTIQVAGLPKPPDPDPKPDPEKPDPDPKPDPNLDPGLLVPIEKDVAADAGGGPVLRAQVGSLTVLTPKRFRIGRSRRLSVGVRTDQAGELTLTLVRGKKKTVARLRVSLAPGSSKQRLKLPRALKAGTHSLKVAFRPAGADWSASGSAKIAFVKAKRR